MAAHGHTDSHCDKHMHAFAFKLLEVMKAALPVG